MVKIIDKALKGGKVLKYLFLILIMLAYLSVFPSLVNAENKTDKYTVGIGDVLTIEVINEPGLKTSTVVAPDGTITFPYIGAIYVEHMTIPEIENEVAKRLSEGYIKYPVVSVSLARSMSRDIYLYGEIGRPGGYSFDEGMTVLKAIARAGGITPGGLYGKVKVRRKKASGEYEDLVEADLNEGVIKDKEIENLLLQPDDIVIIERNKTYFIHGEVRAPGQYILKDGVTALRAISIAGGIVPEGLYGDIKVRRKQEGGGYKEIEIDLKGTVEGSATGDLPLQPDDILIIGRNKTFFVHGEVSRPGEYVLKDGITVTRALSIAGGITANGLYGDIKVRRKQEGGGYKDIEIDLKGIIEGRAHGDMPLQPDDILIVGRNKTYFVYGEVNRPGEYVLKDDMTVFKAITLAGGFTKWGSPRRVKLLRVKKEGDGYIIIKVDLKAVINGDSSADVGLRAGDIIIASTGIL
jgi:polysaccharide export outer membrane protein